MTDMTELWAQAKAEESYDCLVADYEDHGFTLVFDSPAGAYRDGFQDGVKLLADRLLGDEAVETFGVALAKRDGFEHPDAGAWPESLNDDEREFYCESARLALVAALAAVTEGNK